MPGREQRSNVDGDVQIPWPEARQTMRLATIEAMWEAEVQASRSGVRQCREGNVNRSRASWGTGIGETGESPRPLSLAEIMRGHAASQRLLAVID